jgi:HD-like signal output (HDOD) protein
MSAPELSPRVVVPTYCVPDCAGLDLVAELEALPANPSSAMRVLYLAEDANSSASDLGRVVGSDPSLTARIMKVANSAYYGLSGRVSSATFAVTVLGFDTVRAIAAATAAGITGDSGTLPDQFWSHAAMVAVSCSLVAPRVSVRGPEAFSLGLLHDLGEALLHRGLGPLPADAPVEAHDADRVAYERERWGIDHATAASRVLGAWWFPEEFTHAVAIHHDGPKAARSNLQKALIGGEAVARCTAGVEPDWVASTLALVGLEPSTVAPLAEQVRVEAEGLAASLGSL